MWGYCKLSGPLLILLLPLFSFAGGDPVPAGGRSFGLGNASVSLQDPFAVYNNIAGIAALQQAYFFTGCELPYGMLPLKRISAGGILPYKSLRAGFSLYNFGSELYHEFRAGMGIAHKIRHVSLGLKVNYQEIGISETGALKNFVFEFGGITEFSRHLKFGASIYNLNLAHTSPHSKEMIPVVMKAGLSYKSGEHLLFVAETGKASNAPPYLRGGVEYVVSTHLCLRSGISNGPFVYYGGAGITAKNMQVDYSISSHPRLGISHALSLTWKPQKKK